MGFEIRPFFFYKINEEFLISRISDCLQNKWGIPHLFCRKKKSSFCSKTMHKTWTMSHWKIKIRLVAQKLALKYEFTQQNIHKIQKQTSFFLARLRRDQSLWFRKEYSENMRILQGFTKTELFFLQNKWGIWEFKKWGIRKPKKKSLDWL